MAAVAVAVAHSSLSLSAAPARRLSTSSPLLPYFAPTQLSFNTAGSPSSCFPLSTSRSSRATTTVPSATKFSNGRYIREDYLVKKLSAKELQELVKGERAVPLIVDFYATWCGPCILMAQELEMLAVEYEKAAQFVKVDTDDEYEFSRDMQVRGLPTLYFISPDPSKDAIRTEGLIPKDMIKNIIDNEM